MIVKLLTEHHLEFLSLKGGCRSLSESTLVNCQIVENLMPQLIFYFFYFINLFVWYSVRSCMGLVVRKTVFGGLRHTEFQISLLSYRD